MSRGMRFAQVDDDAARRVNICRLLRKKFDRRKLPGAVDLKTLVHLFQLFLV